MFPQLKKINNESGVVLFIVLMTAIIIMIISASILSQSMNEINFAQQEIDQIATDQLAKGMFWNAYSSGGGTSNAITSISTYQNEQNRNYVMTLTPLVTSAGITNYEVDVNYDSFN